MRVSRFTEVDLKIKDKNSGKERLCQQIFNLLKFLALGLEMCIT